MLSEGGRSEGGSSSFTHSHKVVVLLLPPLFTCNVLQWTIYMKLIIYIWKNI